MTPQGSARAARTRLHTEEELLIAEEAALYHRFSHVCSYGMPCHTAPDTSRFEEGIAGGAGRGEGGGGGKASQSGNCLKKKTLLLVLAAAVLPCRVCLALLMVLLPHLTTDRLPRGPFHEVLDVWPCFYRPVGIRPCFFSGAHHARDLCLHAFVRGVITVYFFQG